MSEIQSNTKVARSQVLESRVDEDLILFDAEAGKYFATGSVGADIWKLIESPRTVREVCEVLIERYDVSEETCFSEVQRFVLDLVAAGLAEVR